jgi:hypothetical protein
VKEVKSLLLHQQLASTHNRPTWPIKADRELLAEACECKADSVEFSDGRVFNIKYETQDSLAWGDHEACFVSPNNGEFVPCGWFHIKFLLKPEE